MHKEARLSLLIPIQKEKGEVLGSCVTMTMKGGKPQL